LIGLANKSICSWLAEALRPWFTANNLFVFSSDFSHYPSSADAETVDGYTIDMIMKKRCGSASAILQGNIDQGYLQPFDCTLRRIGNNDIAISYS
jgi:hypothetical protein